MRCRCPHCHNPIEVLSSDELTDIRCESCGSRFALFNNESTTRYEGKQLGQFQLLSQVGRGGFGTVWKARDTELDRMVAIKIPRASQLTEREADSFLREAKSAAQVSHPNIVAVHEIGRDDGTVYIVSDFVDGADLKQFLSARRLSSTETAKLIAQICAALHVAHEAGVIHRDIKPQNILLDQEGIPYIADFGLAKRTQTEITMTLDGIVLGTPAYMSPEQARGDSNLVDRRTDIYSVGVILYELLTGELPFRGDRQMLLLQIQRDEPPRPRSLNSSIPRDLETVCLKCLEKEPNRRYESAQDLANDLNAFLVGEPIAAKPVSTTEHALRWMLRHAVDCAAAHSLYTSITLIITWILISITSANAILNDEVARWTILLGLPLLGTAFATVGWLIVRRRAHCLELAILLYITGFIAAVVAGVYLSIPFFPAFVQSNFIFGLVIALAALTLLNPWSNLGEMASKERRSQAILPFIQFAAFGLAVLGCSSGWIERFPNKTPDSLAVFDMWLRGFFQHVSALQTRLTHPQLDSIGLGLLQLALALAAWLYLCSFAEHHSIEIEAPRLRDRSWF